jgi:chaperone modulatory protein CbpM
MADVDVPTSATLVVEEQVWFDLPSLCRASGADADQLQALVGEGLLQPTGPGPDGWRFAGDALPRARRALRLARDLELELPAVALVMALLAEIDHLRSGLRCG